MRALILLCAAVTVTGGCAPQQRGPLLEQRQIPVITDADIPQKYRAIGQVTAEGRADRGVLDRASANAAISVAAQQKYGSEVDAVIGVQYSAIKGSAYGTTIGTRAIGTAIHLER
jgi:hypothetical protein